MNIHDLARRKIAEIADRQGISYRAWALKAGLGPNAISQFMTTDDDSRTITIDTVQALARTAGVSIADIITDGERPFDADLLASILAVALLTHPDPKEHIHKIAEGCAAMYSAAVDQGIGADDQRALKFAARSQFRE